MENKFLEKEIEKRKQIIIDSGKKDKYNKQGLYGIYLNNKLVYIGKSTNMLVRIANHMLAIDGIGGDKDAWKYNMIRQAIADGYRVRFDVIAEMEGCSCHELSLEEARTIGCRKPILNKQLPALDGSNSWSWNPNAKGKTYEDLKKFFGQPPLMDLA